MSDSINQALEQRPSLESLIQLQLAQRAKIQLARAGRLPSVGLLVGAGVSGNWLDIPNQNVNSSISASNGTNVALPTISTSGSASGSFTDWGAAITVRQPLYDGGFTRESIALAERRAAQAEITIQQAQQAIIQSVETFFATHQAAAPQITAARAAIVAGERSVQDGLLRYRAGLSPLTELLVAQRNLQIARSAEANAIYRWNLSRAALELETGFVR